MLFVLRGLVMVLAFAASHSAPAQYLPPAMVHAARQSVLRSPEVLARWNGLMAAGNEREVARGSLKPQIDLQASTGRENRVTPLADYGSYDFGTYQLSLTQMLFDGQFTQRELKRLGYAKLTRYYELLDASENTALEAVRAYADVVRYRELIEAATQNYIEHKQVTLLVEERANAGVGRRVDVEQANSRLALAESNLLTELTNLHDVSARYMRVVGEMPPDGLPFMPESFSMATLPAQAESVLLRALEHNPGLNAAIENVRALTAAIESRQAAYQPRLEFKAYTSRELNSGGTLGETRLNGVQLLLNYNLYRGGADSARERQAVDLREQARDLQEKACRDMRQTVSIAYNDVRSLEEQRRYMDLRRLTSEKSLDAYRQQFDIGQRSLLDLLDSQNEFFEATRAYTNANYNQIIAQARTLAGMGQLIKVLGVARDDLPTPAELGQDRDLSDLQALCPAQVPFVDSLEKIKAEVVIPPRVRLRPAVPAQTPAEPLAESPKSTNR